MNDYLLEEFKKVCNAQIPFRFRPLIGIENDIRYLQQYLICKYGEISVPQKVSDRIREIGYSMDLGFDKWFSDRVRFYDDQWKKMTDCPDFVYKSLNEIGLENYLRTRGHGHIIKEDWMLNLDTWVKKLPNEQKEKLKEKISKKSAETHIQHNDMFHEISIACAFYNDVKFLPETNKKTPDFCSNGTYVEVKTINNSDFERKRLDELDKGLYCNISSILSQNAVEQIKKKFIDCVGKKFRDHVKKAKEQMDSNGGHVWIVYAIDRPPKFYEDVRKEVKNKLEEIIKELSNELNKSGVDVKYIHFEDLRKKIVS